MEVQGIDGQSFNLVDIPCLSATDYLEELGRHGALRVQAFPTSAWKHYAAEVAKWAVKTITRHPGRQFPCYREWESRSQKAIYDCSKAISVLNWKPAGDRQAIIDRGIRIPIQEWLA
jgi:hypothetical protein